MDRTRFMCTDNASKTLHREPPVGKPLIYTLSRLSHPKSVSVSKAAIVALLFILCCVQPISMAGTIYVYELDGGSHLITDLQQTSSRYRLIKQYSTEPFSKRGYDSSYISQVVHSRFDELIMQAAGAHSLDPALLKALVHVESAFDPFAISRTGAMGLMQMMPGTAARYRLASNQFDPQRNLHAGAQHLRDLLIQFDENIRLAIAGYNAGANAVIKYNGVPPYEETKSHVDKVMELYSKYLKLGFGSATFSLVPNL
jgi:hypothetical protein